MRRLARAAVVGRTGAGLLALAALLAGRAYATTILPVDLPTMTGKAATIFVGHVLEIRTGTDPRGLPATWTTFAVDERLKGRTGETVTVKQLGAASPPAPDGRLTRVPALPTYRVGEEVLLFLHPESAAGFTSPVGFGQGCFRIHDDGGARVATNDVANANLPAPTASTARRAAPPLAAPPKTLPAVPLDELVARVRTLVDAAP